MQKLRNELSDSGVGYTIAWIMVTLFFFGVFALMTQLFWGTGFIVVVALVGLLSTGAGAVNGLLELKKMTGG